MADVDIVVVGGGPVGETLLVQLGHRGLRAIGLERDADVWPKPRAVHFDAEVFRSFQPTGLADAVAGLCIPMRTYRMENEVGEVLQELTVDGPTVHGWTGANMFNQPSVDAFLRAEIDRLPTVELRTGRSVTQISQDADEVVVVAETASGARETVTARWVVGCDGAGSTVRKLAGIEWEVLGQDDQWLVADGALPGAPPIKDTAEGGMVFFGHHSRPHIWASMPDRRARMEFKVMPGDDLEHIGTPEGVTAMSGGVLTPENFTLIRTAVYTFRSRVARRWRSGRIFLAGDAAHLTPPLFGQGLCSGIRDAANLAWKFELVAGGASEDVLDTYESERAPHARAWIEHATAMSRIVQATDPAVAAQRDAHIRANPHQGEPISPSLGPGIHSGESPAGRPAPQPVLPDGRRFDDLIGNGFAVVGDAELLAGLPADVRAELDGSPHITVVDPGAPGVPEFLEALAAMSSDGSEVGDGLAAVLRPDRYLLGLARTSRELATQCRMAVGVCGRRHLKEPLAL